MSTFEFCEDCIGKGSAMLKDYDEQMIEKVEKLKAPIISELKLAGKYDTPASKTVTILLNGILKKIDALFSKQDGGKEHDL